MCESMHRGYTGKEVIEDRSEEVEGAEARKVVPLGDYLHDCPHHDTPSRAFSPASSRRHDALYLPWVAVPSGGPSPREGVEAGAYL